MHLLGKDDSLQLDENGLCCAVVLKLVEGLQDSGHHIYMDNLYSSPTLFKLLRERGLGACGTVREDRRGMPKKLFKPKMIKGEMKTAVLEGEVQALKWMDKRAVKVLTTIHGTSMVPKRRRSRLAIGGIEEVMKPTAIEQYNQHMGGVDKSDQLLSYYGFSHRTVKWWRRAFFHLLDLSVVNAFILYRQTHTSKPSLTHEQFRVELVKELLLMAGSDLLHESALHPSLPPSERLYGRHFPEKIPVRPSGALSQPDCCVCSNQKERRRKTTTYRCKQCMVPLCVVPCFELYHTHVDPTRFLS